jgi:hypothetical protein
MEHTTSIHTRHIVYIEVEDGELNVYRFITVKPSLLYKNSCSHWLLQSRVRAHKYNKTLPMPCMRDS